MNWTSITAMMQNIDWQTVSNIAVVITALLIIQQLTEMRRTTHAQSYSIAMQYLQDEAVRQARKIVFHLKSKPLSQWNDAEIAAAERVCHTYDVVGQMIRHHLLPKDIVINSWGHSIRNSFPIVAPLIYQYRQQRDANELWDDYEWLAMESKRVDTRRRRLAFYQDRFNLPKNKVHTNTSSMQRVIRDNDISILTKLLNTTDF